MHKLPITLLIFLISNAAFAQKDSTALRVGMGLGSYHFMPEFKPWNNVLTTSTGYVSKPGMRIFFSVEKSMNNNFFLGFEPSLDFMNYQMSYKMDRYFKFEGTQQYKLGYIGLRPYIAQQFALHSHWQLGLKLHAGMQIQVIQKGKDEFNGDNFYEIPKQLMDPSIPRIAGLAGAGVGIERSLGENIATRLSLFGEIIYWGENKLTGPTIPVVSVNLALLLR